MANRMHLITSNNPYTPPELGSPENGGLSYVDFHRLANRVLDAFDPKLGQGKLYTPEEIERNCQAREILASELYTLLASHQKAIEQRVERLNTVESQFMEARAELSRFKVNQPVPLPVPVVETKPEPRIKRKYTYKAGTGHKVNNRQLAQLAREEKEHKAWVEHQTRQTQRAVRPPDSVLKPVTRSEYDASVFTGNSGNTGNTGNDMERQRRDREIDSIVNGNGDTTEEQDSGSNPNNPNPPKWVM
jgi:hypothetical protein